MTKKDKIAHADAHLTDALRFYCSCRCKSCRQAVVRAVVALHRMKARKKQ